MKNLPQRLDFNLLKALDALLEERNVTRAAKKMGVTQPAMSSMLNRLRESFGDPLFVRAPHGIVPTERALAAAAPLRRMMAEVADMLQPSRFEPEIACNRISIASTDYGLSALVAPFLISLKQRAPYIQTALLPIQDNQIQNRLEQGWLDIALMSASHLQTELHSHHLYREGYSCVMRKDHPMADKELTLDEFCRLDFALMSYEGGGFYGATDEALAKLGCSRRVSLSVTNFLLLPEILRNSDMVAMIPKRMPLDDGLIRRRAPLNPEGFSMEMVWHDRTDRDPAHRWIREQLIEHVKQTS